MIFGFFPLIQEHNDKGNLLSEREKDVLSLLVRGYINKEIADKLNISKTTVTSHRNNIAEKLGDRSIGRLTIYAVLNGIVDLHELCLSEPWWLQNKTEN